MTFQDFFAQAIAYDPATETLVTDAEFTVHAVDDTALSTPLVVTDPASGVTITTLRSSSVGVLPDMRVAGDPVQVLIKSGSFVTKITSVYGAVVQAGLDPATVQSAILAGSSASAARNEAVVARDQAVSASSAAAASAAEVASVIPTNDGIMTAVAQDRASAFAGQLNATIGAEVSTKGNQIVETVGDQRFSRSCLALTTKATISARFADRDFRAEGVRIAPSLALTQAPGAVDSSDRLIARPTLTNQQPAFSGGTVGVIGSGGALPAGWSAGSASVVKEILAVTPESITVKLTPPGAQTDHGSLRLPSFTPDGVTNFGVDLEISTANGASPMYVTPGWWDGSAISSSISEVYYSTDLPRRVTFALPDPAAARQLVLVFGTKAPSTTAVTVKISRVTAVSAVTATSDPTRQPQYFTGTVAASTAILNVPDGEYVLVADTVEAGVVRERVMVASSGLDIAAALKGYLTVASCWVTPLAIYDDRDLDALGAHDWESPKDTYVSPFMAALATRRVASQPLDSAFLGNPKRSIGISRSRPGRYRFDVRPGEVAPGDGVTQERAEIVSSQSVPFNTDIDIAFGFEVLEFPVAPTTDYDLICQWKYTSNTSGDSSALSPDFSVVLSPLNAGTMTLRVGCRTDGGIAVLSGSGIPTGITTAVPVTAVVNIGQRYEVYARIRFSDSGGGYLRFCLDGVEMFAGSVAVGYKRNNGPRFHFGSYSNDMDSRRRIEFRQPEFGPADLSDRIGSPLPW